MARTNILQLDVVSISIQAGLKQVKSAFQLQTFKQPFIANVKQIKLTYLIYEDTFPFTNELIVLLFLR